MKKLVLLLVMVAALSSAQIQAIYSISDTTKYSYCELFATPKGITGGMVFEVAIFADNMEEFKTDTIYAPLLMEKNRPKYSTIITPLNIMGSRGWRLVLKHSSVFQGVTIDRYILERAK